MTRVLVVEDSRTQAEELRILLETEGFDVALARDGREGLKHCQAHPVDVVLSDVVMPELDGYELCKQLKANAATAAIPVILLTALTDPMDIVRGLECGADNFITKPYDAAYLLGRIRRLLDNKALRGVRKVALGVDLLLMGKHFTINSEKEQMLDLLISTFEEVMRSRQREYEAKLSEETVRESHRFLQSALDGLTAKITVLDRSGVIRAANAPWRAFIEENPELAPRAGVNGRYLDVCQALFGTDPTESTKLREGVRSVLDGLRNRFSLEYTVRLGTGTRWFALRASRFEDQGTFLVAVEHDDITARKELEQQFQQSQKLEAVGQLASGVAHDFNNLLTVIRGYAGFLLDSFEENDDRRADVEQILGASDTAASLTRQLLAFSRRQVLRPAIIDVNRVVDEMEKMLRRIVGEDISYCTVLAEDLGAVYADPAQIQQVLLNLVINARDAMPSGGKLTVETENATLDAGYAAAHPGVAPGSYICISVTDTGCGMDAGVQSRIFEPFFTTKEVGKGTGLGLSTVYGIVQQSGGTIQVTSEIGRGTRFKIHLPRVAQEHAPIEEGESERAPAHPASETILVVEDNDSVRAMLCRVLRGVGYTVLEAGSAADARTLCESHRDAIQMLISDVVMPEMSGVDLARVLLTTHPEMKVLMMSGYSGMALISEIEARPGTSFVEKPFTAESISRKVRALLEQEA